jgi:O-antigen/teichoic acid export membrane protein
MPKAEIHIGRSLLSGGIWMTALRWSRRGLGLVTTFVLARLLTPGDFGLVAMAMGVIGLIEILGYAGQMMALIRHPAPTREHYDSVWTLSILLSACLMLLLWALAGPAGLYFHQPRVVWLVRFLALRTLIGGFENVGVVNFRRELRFDRDFIYLVLQRLLVTVVTIGLAVWLRDWRALAAGYLAGGILGVMLSYVMHPYRPRLCFSRIREVLAFSGWMLTVNIAVYINRRADQLAVGSLGSPMAMGAYSVAEDTATAPTVETVLPVARALFPVFSRIRDDTAAMRAAYLNVLSAACILSVALGGGIALVADDFVRIALGPKWLIAVPMVRILAIAGGLFVIMENSIPVLTATGHERLAAQLAVTRAASLVLAVGLAAWFGDAMAIAYARVAVTLVFIPGIFLTIARVLPVTLADMLTCMWRPFAAGLVMAGCVLTVHGAMPDVPALRLAIDVAAGAVGYVAATLLLWGLAGCPRGLEASAVNWLLSRPMLARLGVSP